MAHFAKIEDNIVTNVVVVDNEYEENGQEYLNSLGLDGIWIQTSYNSNFRKKYAAIGDTYDPIVDGFKPPQPYVSWIWNSDIWQWEAPVEMPSDGQFYSWDEETLAWKLSDSE